MTYEERSMELEDELPDFYTGMRTEVLNPLNHLIFVGKIELLKEGLLQITEESGENVPWVEYNTKIKLRGFQRGGMSFSVYAYVCGSSEKFWRCDRLELLQKAELRRFYRQIVNLPATVVCVNQLFVQRTDLKSRSMGDVPCTVLDLSGNGVRLRCDKANRFEVGDWLFLSMADPLKANNCMNYTCCIRRVQESRSGVEYGCELENLSETEQERLLQTVMNIQQKELRARRSRGRD